MTVQFVEIAGHRMVVLPEDDYRRMCAEIEDSNDVAAAAAAEARAQAGEEYVPAALVDRIIDGDAPLRVWRDYRGLTQAALGAMVGLNKMTISGIESGRRDTTSRNWRKLADALSVDVDDILPLDVVG